MTTASLHQPAPPSDAYRPPPARATRLYALDALRLVCALGVAGYHFGDSWRVDGVSPPTHFLPHAAPVLIYGFLGVETFFLISGFVILMSGWGRTVRDFAASRAARLYPAFWVGVLATTVVTTLLPISGGLPSERTPDFSQVLVNLTMLGEPLGIPLADTVYWTLWVEFRFYLIVACLIAVGLTDRRVKLFGTAWLGAALLIPAFPGAALDQVVMSDWAPYFIAGMTMFLLRRNRSDRWLWALLVACWLTSLYHVHARAVDLHPGYHVPIWPAPLLLTIAYMMMLAIALGITDRWNWRWLGTAGALTYPFYLMHQRIGYSLIRTLHSETGLPVSIIMTGTVLGLLGLAWLVHRLVERPLAPVVRRFVRGREQRSLAAATASSVRDE